MWGGWAVIVTIMISSSEAFSDAFILPYYPPCITHYPSIQKKQNGTQSDQRDTSAREANTERAVPNGAK
jgi:hypothetical protein